MNNTRTLTIMIVAVVCTAAGFIGGVYLGRVKGIPLVKTQMVWSIGIYSGSDPFNFSSDETTRNPVLTAREVTDVPAEFVADPFMVREGTQWYMFFEIMNAHTQQGDIGVAVSSDGYNWSYSQVVLDEPFHLSYPYVFKEHDVYYMIPESSEVHAIRLYRADNFPTRWSFTGTLREGCDFVDSSVFRYNNKWWLFTTPTLHNNMLRLFYADLLSGPWTEHPRSPLIREDANIARSGGRVLPLGNTIIRYAQDDDPSYGNQVHAFETHVLTETDYQEKEVTGNPIIKGSGKGWNALGMHHIDPHPVGLDKWIACVDGLHTSLKFGWGY